MKKNSLNIGAIIMALVFLVLFAQPANAQTQSNLAWTKIVSPEANISSVTISPDNTIYVTGRNIIHVSYDTGTSWSSFPITFASAYIDHAVWFKDKLYVGCEVGIISTADDGQTWQLSQAGYGFPALAANSQYLFVFGINNSFKTDGLTWVSINSPDAVTVAAADESAITVVSSGSGSTSTVYKSYDNGETWTLVDQLNIDPISLSVNSGQYDVVGFTSDHKLSSRGQYTYDYSSGYLMTVNYFNGECLTGGSENLNSSFYRGIIFSNGDLNSAVYFDGEVVSLASNNNLAIANVLGSDLYLSSAKTNNLVDEAKPKKVLAYPNPTNDVVFVDSPVTQPVGLRDLSGQLIREYRLLAGKNCLDFSALRSGMYFLGGNSKAIKIIKQ